MEFTVTCESQEIPVSSFEAMRVEVGLVPCSSLPPPPRMKTLGGALLSKFDGLPKEIVGLGRMLGAKERRHSTRDEWPSRAIASDR